MRPRKRMSFQTSHMALSGGPCVLVALRMRGSRGEGGGKGKGVCHVEELG